MGEDLHLKMCKKIAQLTKVVFNLNTKVEENKSVMGTIKEENDRRVEKLSKDNDEKLKEYKEQYKDVFDREKQFDKTKDDLLESRNENKRLETLLKENEVRHDLYTEQLKSEHEKKCLQLEGESKKEKSEHMKLRDCFHALQEECKYERAQLSYKHKLQLDMLHNEYNGNLSTQQKKIELLEHDLQHLNDKQKEFEDEKTKLKKSHEKRVNELKEVFENEIEAKQNSQRQVEKIVWQEEQMTIISEFQMSNDELKSQICDLQCRVEKQDEEILVLSSNLKTGEENEKKNNELLDTYKSNIKSLEDCINSKLEFISLSERNLLEREGRIDVLQSIVDSLGMLLETQPAGLLSKVRSLKGQLQDQSLTCEERKVKLMKKVEEVNELSSCILKLREENAFLLKCHDQLNDESSSRWKQLQEKLTEKDDMCSVLRSKHEDDRRSAEQKIQLLERTHLKELVKIRDTHAKNISIFKSESERLLTESQQKLCEDFERKRVSMLHEHELSVEQYKEKVQTLETDLEIKCEEIQSFSSQFSGSLEEAKQLELKLNQKVDGLNAKLVERDNSITDLETRIVERDNSITDLETRIFERDNSITDLETRIVKLKASFDEMRMSLEKESKTVQAVQASKLKEERLIEERKWKEILKSETLQWENKLQALRESSNSILLQSKEDASRSCQQKNNEIHSFKCQVGELSREMEDMTSHHKQQIEDLQTSLTVEKGRLEEQFRKERNVLIDEQIHEIEQLKELFDKDKKAALAEMQTDHDATLLEILNVNKIAVDALRSTMTIEMETSLSDVKEELRLERAELKAVLLQEHACQLHQLTKKHEDEITVGIRDLEKQKELRRKEFTIHTNKIARLLKKLDEEKEQTTTLNCKIEELNEDCIAIRKEVELKGLEVLEVRRECNITIKARVDDLKQGYDERLQSMNANHTRAMTETLSEWRVEKEKYEGDVHELKGMLEKAEERYRHRPSRLEDIDCIAHLKQQLVDQDNQYRRLLDEKKQYRLELLNREENFNKVFKAAPNVGFMNPIDVSKKRSAKKREVMERKQSVKNL